MMRRPSLRTTFAALGLALTLALPAAARAQVGYTPEQSPFRDLEYKHEITGLLGWYKAQKDRVGIAPQSGPIVSGRYSYYLGGPAYLTSELGVVFSNRQVINPSRPVATRNVTEESTRLYMADVGVALALTGHRSWHRIVPEVSTGLGIVASSRRGVDVGGYQFGTPFALSLGSGIRWVPGGRYLVRADLKGRLYKVTYPATYFQATSDNSPVLGAGVSRSGWTMNPALSLGVSYLLGR